MQTSTSKILANYTMAPMNGQTAGKILKIMEMEMVTLSRETDKIRDAAVTIMVVAATEKNHETQKPVMIVIVIDTAGMRLMMKNMNRINY